MTEPLRASWRKAGPIRTIFPHPRMARAKGPSQAGVAETERFDMDAAIRFLKWREEKRQGYGRRGRHRKSPPDRTIEEARASILRKIEAIERHVNRRRLAEGWRG